MFLTANSLPKIVFSAMFVRRVSVVLGLVCCRFERCAEEIQKIRFLSRTGCVTVRFRLEKKNEFTSYKSLLLACCTR